MSVTITKEVKMSVHCKNEAVPGARAVMDCVNAAVLTLMMNDKSKKGNPQHYQQGDQLPRQPAQQPTTGLRLDVPY
jgi:hypothetical protein